MTPIKIILEGDGAFPECKPETFGQVTAMARLAAGMASGKASVTIEIQLPDGTKVYGQTSLALVEQAVTLFHIREQAQAQACGARSH